MPKKIAIVFPSPAFRPTGGFKIIYEYLNALSKKNKNISFDIYYDNSLNSSKNFIKRNSKYLISKIYPFWNWFKFNPQIGNHLHHIVVSELKKEYMRKYNLIIITSVETAIKVHNLKLNTKKLYFIQHYENWGVSDKELHKTYKYENTYNIVVSKWLKEKVEGSGGKVDLYLPNCIDTNIFHAYIKPEKKNPFIVGMLYHKIKWKGTKEGIESLKLLKKDIPNLKGILFGAFPKPKDLPSWIEYYKKPSPNELREIYNRCSIFLSPSYKEGFGLPAAEAMACGCAVVATRSGGVEDFCVDKETALLVKSPPNPHEIKENIKFLIKNDKFRINLAYRGQNYIEKNFSHKKFEENVNRLINLINSLS